MRKSSWISSPIFGVKKKSVETNYDQICQICVFTLPKTKSSHLAGGHIWAPKGNSSESTPSVSSAICLFQGGHITM